MQKDSKNPIADLINSLDAMDSLHPVLLKDKMYLFYNWDRGKDGSGSLRTRIRLYDLDNSKIIKVPFHSIVAGHFKIL